MSGSEAKPEGSNLPAVQRVGYGSPPVEHRFQKGKSGNPAGRPRKAKKAAASYDPADQPTSRMILEEAYRPVTIREGDKVIELPAIQAVMRAMGVSAMKGNRLAQKTMAQIVQSVEAEEQSMQLRALEGALEYKQQWTREIERCRREGLPIPTPVPHPDDVKINMRTGKVRTEGPLTADEKVRWDERIARRNEAQEEVSLAASRYKRAREPRRKELWLQEWHFEQRIFDLINDVLPDHYKAELKDRSYDEGASKPGTALKQFLAERRMKGRANDNGD